MLTTTAIYACLLTIVFLWLSLRVIGFRRSNKIALGDNGDRMLLRRTRVQANFTEYVPITLILIAIAEINGTPDWVIHLSGAAIVTGRILHAIGFSSEPDILPLRVSGMMLTLTAILIAVAANLFALVS
ncbi:MAG: MAPEG family protein [Aquisalinus sp.]|nr:MAPEG family protein [Aquisalinus sp.]